MNITIEELRLPVRGASAAVDRELHDTIAKHLSVLPDDILSYRIIRRSIDARKKPQVFLLYRLHVSLRDSAIPRNCAAEPHPAETYVPPEAANRLTHPLVVGTGPAGLFAALILAEAGCRPILLDRGCDVAARKQDIETFFRTRQVNPDSNFLYGEGGAGTWSDGKLFTRIRDPRIRFVLETFVQHGAQKEILYYAHPHIGSDRLPQVIAGIRQQIIELGGTVLWGKQVKELLLKNGSCAGVRLTDGETLEAPSTLIAAGHSARDLILALVRQGVRYTMKGFQTGVRIEHPQYLIDKLQFGGSFPALGAAEYNICDPGPNGAGTTSFCMCPGGEVIPAVSRSGFLCTNGMSNAARSGKYANSALVTTLPAETFASPEEAFRFLEASERNIFLSGGSDYTAPAQNAADFLAGRKTKKFSGTSYRMGLVSGRLDELLPPPLCRALFRALPRFERKMPGFLSNGLMIGIETGVSSPVRFLRDPETLSSSIPGLRLAGEGGGTAGGITSAAVDGILAAEQMLQRG